MSKSWSLPTRYFVMALMLLGLIWFLVAANDLFGALAIAALLAYILNPAVTYVHTHTPLRRSWAVMLVFLLALAVLITLGIIFIPILPQQIASLSHELQLINLQIQETLAQPITFLGFELPVDQALGELRGFSTDFVRPDIILGMLQAASTNLGWLLVILVTTYYLLQDWSLLREWLLKLAPDVYQSDMRRLYDEIRTVWQRYLRGQLRLTFIIGVITGIVSAIIGLPGAVAFGILAGVMDIILTVGPAIVMAAAGLVAFFVGSTHLPMSNGWFTILVLGLYGLIQTVENIWLRPRVMGHSLRLHPGIVFVAIVGSLALAGVLAALIVIPVVGSVIVIGRYTYYKCLDIPPWPEERDERVRQGQMEEEDAPVESPDGPVYEGELTRNP